MIWQAIAGQTMKTYLWDNELVVYNQLSGDTHLLGASAAQILLHLQIAPAEAMSLAESLALTWEGESEQELMKYVEHILSELEALALIEPISS